MTHSSAPHTQTTHRTLWRFALAWVGLGGGSRAEVKGGINSTNLSQLIN